MNVKYGIWKVNEPDPSAVNTLVRSGYAPLAAMVLAARGICSNVQAHKYLDCDTPLLDPFLMTDMDKAAGRVGLAMARGEKIAVFGDYDVDGITSTCLLTDFLRRHGANVVSYIPGRLEEGYGLNPIAIAQLSQEGVQLIITVDCGITAVAEAELCRELGIDLVITDHHECKDALPYAAAVVDPHRPDGGYPHKNLSGVGVAFKLASALCGDQEEVLRDYADMVCLGTVADVMPLQGENRVFVARGLQSLARTTRPGIAALMAESGCDAKNVSASSIGFMLAPRINAAGRMGKIELAVELFLTDDPGRAAEVAKQLCDLNRQRQSVESEIYDQAVAMLPAGQPPEAIVLADETWHQGVVGIVASRIAEEYACPAFLICLDGEHGKASSRSHGGFNLFASLTALSSLLESYGGHELAAGFTINRANIPEFRRQICQLAAGFYSDDTPRTSLEIDCAIPAELLTISNIESLSVLEPCGNCCPKPVLMMKNLTIERITMVGGGRHMRLRLRSGRFGLNAIYFSANPAAVSIQTGDVVDIAFTPQVNEFRGERSVQMNVQDIRPSCTAECSPETAAYHALAKGCLTREIAEILLPERSTLAMVWRYLAAASAEVEESPICLCRKIVRWTGKPLSLGQMMTCLDIFRDVGLLEAQRVHKNLRIRLTPGNTKADLTTSQTMQRLLQVKES
ncbi:MAG: single-stranded-DNA-specific exonuclease RecJ [Oscillospiraceae bacterium]|nr:single-stranded-DNA-specific exonuclease RecJ [Oscillospiraceae bacterium]